MITSSLENEGKSSLAANLAIALAQNDHKVLLIDGDGRTRRTHEPAILYFFNFVEYICVYFE